MTQYMHSWMPMARERSLGLTALRAITTFGIIMRKMTKPPMNWRMIKGTRYEH